MIKRICINRYVFSYDFLEISACKYFRDFFVNEYIPADQIIENNYSQLSENANRYQTSIAREEITYLLGEISRYLILNNSAVFHGVSFELNGYSYVLTAKSGTGKSTQFKNLKSLYSDQIQIMNGDKPVLDFISNDSVIVYPSPWNGKERWGSGEVGKLRGIIYLLQSDHNYMDRLSPEEAVISVFKQFLYIPDDTVLIENVSRMTEMMLKNVPVWYFENTGTLESSQYLYDKLMEYQESLHE